MITYLIFFIGVGLTYILNIAVHINHTELWEMSLIFLFSLVVIILINAVMAIVCAKVIPTKCFNQNSKFYSPSKRECRFYERLGIKKWKDHYAEFGKLNGFKKDKIENPNEPKYINKFILECNKGFLVHLSSIIFGPLVLISMPLEYYLTIGLPFCIISTILNLLPIMILRYNIPRLKTLLKFAERKSNKEANNQTK